VPTGPRETQGSDLWSPSIGVSVRPLPWVAVQANFGRYNRPPNFSELFGTRGFVHGNPNLQPEPARNSDVGFFANAANLGWLDEARLEYAYFYNEIDDLIALTQTSQTSFTFVNFSSARAQGIGLNLQTTWKKHLGVIVNYTNRTRTNLRETYFGNRLPPADPTGDVFARRAVQRLRATLCFECDLVGGNSPHRRTSRAVATRATFNLGFVVNVSQWLAVGFEADNFTGTTKGARSPRLPAAGTGFIGSVTAGLMTRNCLGIHPGLGSEAAREVSARAPRRMAVRSTAWATLRVAVRAGALLCGLGGERLRKFRPRWGVLGLLTVALILVSTAVQARCGGDCNGDGVVTTDEIVSVVNVRLGHAAAEACPPADTDFDGEVSAADPQAAVGNALAGCAAEDHTAFIVATDYQTGSFATVTLDEPRQVEKANPQRRLHSDAVARDTVGSFASIDSSATSRCSIRQPASPLWQCSTVPKRIRDRLRQSTSLHQPQSREGSVDRRPRAAGLRQLQDRRDRSLHSPTPTATEMDQMALVGVDLRAHPVSTAPRC
jgi:hypothetical protein